MMSYICSTYCSVVSLSSLSPDFFDDVVTFVAIEGLGRAACLLCVTVFGFGDNLDALLSSDSNAP